MLRRDIRRWDLVALVLNSVIGAGIFGLPSRVYALAGAFSLASYIVCAVPVLLIVFCLAEVSSRFKETGGVYLYTRSAFGNFVGFQIGYFSWLSRMTALAAVSNLFADYLGYFVPVVQSGTARMAVITLAIGTLAAANIAGVRFASQLSDLFTIGKVVPLVLLVSTGLFFVDVRRYSFTTLPTYSNFSVSVLLLVFAFLGFESAGMVAGEVEDPRKNVPFAMVAGVGLAAVLYVGIQAVCVGVVPQLAASARPLADAGEHVLGKAGGAIISLGALISVGGTMHALMLSSPRILFAMGEQGQLPSPLSTTSKRFQTPHVAIILSTAVVIAFALSGTFVTTATLTTIMRLVVYAGSCAALPVLRRRNRGDSALFLIPGGTILSIIALGIIVWLFSSSPSVQANQAFFAAAAGLILYGLFGRAPMAERIS
jgi:amino acid transporter